MPGETAVYIGLGINSGSREKNINKALDAIAAGKHIKLFRTSSIIETEPLSNIKQRDYLNCVAEIKTNLKAVSLLKVLKKIESKQSVYSDVPFSQDYSVRYYLTKEQQPLKLFAISANRDGQIRILSDRGVLVPDNGSLFYSGKLIPDISYTPLISKKITAIETYSNQTVYLDDQQVFSNAWAGKIQIEHGLSKASVFAGGKDFHFLVSDGEHLVYIDQAGNRLWSGFFKGLRQIRYQEMKNSFLLISSEQVAEFIPGQPIKELCKRSGITCAASFSNGEKLVVGTTAGYVFLSDKKMISKIPCPEITDIKEINGKP